MRTNSRSSRSRTALSSWVIITGEDILRAEGRLRLRTSDGQTVQDHIAWVMLEPTLGVIRGFSLGVKGGLVVAIYRYSTMNPGDDGRLEEELMVQLRKLLPLDPDCRMFEE